MADGNMMAPVSASARGAAHASKDAARIMLRTESMRLKNFGPLPSMRNPPTRRVVRRAWTVGRLTGSLPFPRACKLFQSSGLGKLHWHDGLTDSADGRLRLRLELPVPSSGEEPIFLR